MSEEISLEAYKNAYSEIYKEQRRKSFFSHLTIYLLVNAISVVINLLFTPTFLWVIFPIIFWGIGVLWNYLVAIVWIDRSLHETSLKAEYLVRQKNKTGNNKL